MMTPGTGSDSEPVLSATQKLEIMARLAGGVAHDFNNLLTVILGGCELMAIREQRQGTSTKGSLVQMVKDTADRGVTLTRQLLAFCRRQHLMPIVVDVNAAVAAAHASLRHLLPEDIAIETVLDKDAGCLRADAGALLVALTNLALNARDAMPSGGALTIETRRCELGDRRLGLPESVPPGAYVRCRIADTGCGMTEEVRAHVCEPYFTTKDAGKGAGLGLAAVYGIVKQSQGFLQVQSKPGRGCTVDLYFPCATAAAEATPAAVRPTRRFSGCQTVLLVDDEESVRAIASQSLTRDQFTVLEAGDGDQALQVSRRWPQAIHVMVTDVLMPRMNGRQLAEQIAPERPEMRIMFMSGYTEEEVVTSKVSGAQVPFLPKPFTSEGLVSKVRDLLAG